MKRFFLFAALILMPALPLTAHAADATSFNPTTVKVTAKPISSIPVGTIISWPVAQNPADWQNPDGSYNWLECNGQTISQAAYPELFALMGGRVPDLRGRVTWGDSVPGKKIEAGLPEIRGSAPSMTFSNTHIDGAFVVSSYGNGFSLYSVPYGEPQQGHADFSASRSSPVYGRSTTVQPPSYTVRYLVRARP